MDKEIKETKKVKEIKDNKETKKVKENKKKSRCFQCRKRITMISFTCKCGKTLCVSHQSPHSHGCVYDYQTEIRKKIEMTNPKVVPSTLVNPI
jgi:hypothetical protein